MAVEPVRPAVEVYWRPGCGFCSSVMVAPRPRAVIDRLVDTDPDLVSDARRWPPWRVAQSITVTILVVSSFVIGRTGNDALGLLLGGTAVAAYLGFRRVRSRVHSSRPGTRESGP